MRSPVVEHGSQGRQLERQSAPPHATLNAIFAGMMPSMAIQVIAFALHYVFPGIGLRLPHTLYK